MPKYENISQLSLTPVAALLRRSSAIPFGAFPRKRARTFQLSGGAQTLADRL